MKPPGHRLCDAFLIARSVVDQVAGRQAPPPWEMPLSAVLEHTKRVLPELQIDLQRRDFAADQVASALFRYPQRALILYAGSLNICWRRFALCKELAHLLIDDKGGRHFSTDGEAIISELITQIPHLEPESEMSSEMVTVLIAMEILLPWRQRRALLETSRWHSDAHLALRCRVPEKFIHHLLHTDYLPFSQSLNERLDGEAQSRFDGMRDGNAVLYGRALLGES